MKWKARLVSRPTICALVLFWAEVRAPGRPFSPDSIAGPVRLAQMPGVSLYSLQKAHPQRSGFATVPLTDLGPQLEDFSDTAIAAIAELDLVVSVDTSVAHLAGASETGLAIAADGLDWRWLRERNDTPWYPSAGDLPADRAGRLDRRDRASARRRRRLERSCPSSVPVAGAAISSKESAATTAHSDEGLSAVAETRHGIMQYLPDERDVGASLRWYGEYLETELRWSSPFLLYLNAVMMECAGVGAHAVFLPEPGRRGSLVCIRTSNALRTIRQNLKLLTALRE